MNWAARGALATRLGNKIWFTKKSGEEPEEPKKEEVIVRSMEEDAKDEDGWWAELKEFCGAHAIECSAFALFLFFCIFCVFNAFGFIGSNDLSLRSEHYKQFVANLCQFPENRDLKGSEGQTTHPNATLISLLAVVRHGDRYEVQKENTTGCQELNEQESQEFEQYLTAAKRIDLTKILSMTPELEKLQKLPDREVCEAKALTPRGAIQEFALGKYLFEKYKNTKLFNTSQSAINISIIATQMQRTVASGVALLGGILDQNGTKFTTPITFKSGLVGCTDAECDCDENFGIMYDLVGKEREGLFRLEASSHLRRLAEAIVENNTIGMEEPSVDPNQILDYLVAGLVCQREPLPCPDERHCVSYPFIGELIEYSVKLSKNMFELDMGIEKQYRVITAFPILRSLALMVERNEKEVQLFSSHDHVIVSVLRVLTLSGNYSEFQVYTARLVFEIYETTDGSRLFRVLYNGEDATSSVKFCEQLEYGLCSVAQLQKFIAKDIFGIAGFKSFNDTCYSNF
ncbi:unnamed protein product [Caenorhabditis sp. 36 PRJEB53466]|nr:unnamed protein product [Caenorhabditis sp. 36 PRJEB53466]